MVCLIESARIESGSPSRGGHALGATAPGLSRGGCLHHRFEDRVMKVSHLHIGPGCSVGSNSIVRCDTTMHPGLTLGALPLLMNGESLAPHTRWAAIRAQRAARTLGGART